MRISATGNKPARQRGFTLAEVLIVIAIIGLVGAVVAVTLPRRAGLAEDQAELLAARIRTAASKAIIAGRPIGLEIDEAGYRFSLYAERAWGLVRTPPLAPHDFPDALIVRIEADGLRSNRRRSEREENAELTVLAPVLRFEPTGEAPAFRAELDDREERWRVVSDGVGGAVVERVSP